MGNKEIKEVLLSSSVTDEKNVINYLKLQNSNAGNFESKHGFSMSPLLNSYLQLAQTFSGKEELNSILLSKAQVHAFCSSEEAAAVFEGRGVGIDYNLKVHLYYVMVNGGGRKKGREGGGMEEGGEMSFSVIPVN